MKHSELTIRGLLLGAVIAAVFTAANVYLGLKVAITLAVIGAVVAEFQGGTGGGLGYLIFMDSGQGETAGAFACITLLAIISIALYYALVGLERLLLPWAPSESRQDTV